MKTKLVRWLRSAGRIGACAGLALAALVAWPPQSASGQERDELTQNPIAGSQVFGAKGCVKCHSVNGLGGSVGPDLGRISRRRSFHELAATMWNHLPSMGKAMREYGIERPQMDSREAGDLIGFLFTLDYFDPPGDVDIGQRLFSEKKCVVCHQVGLYGGVVGPSLDFLAQYGSPILVAAAMWNHGPTMAENMKARGIDRPTFTGSELTDLISYLESVGPEPLQGPLYVLPGRAGEGRIVFFEKRCIECHSVGGLGGRVGPDLAQRGVQMSLSQFAAGMWNKEPAMTAAMKRQGISVPQLGAGEMADLVAYLYSVRYFAESGDPDAGRGHLSRKGCLRCHSLTTARGSSAGNLSEVRDMGSPAAVFAALWNHSILMESAQKAEGFSWPNLTPEEMADVAAFLQSREARR